MDDTESQWISNYCKSSALQRRILRVSSFVPFFVLGWFVFLNSYFLGSFDIMEDLALSIHYTLKVTTIFIFGRTPEVQIWDEWHQIKYIHRCQRLKTPVLWFFSTTVVTVVVRIEDNYNYAPPFVADYVLVKGDLSSGKLRVLVNQCFNVTFGIYSSRLLDFANK